jgi:hypothetical protein
MKIKTQKRNGGFGLFIILALAIGGTMTGAASYIAGQSLAEWVWGNPPVEQSQ